MTNVIVGETLKENDLFYLLSVFVRMSHARSTFVDVFPVTEAGAEHTEELVGRIARETNELANHACWKEILVRLIASGMSAKNALGVRQDVWRIRKQIRKSR